MSRKSEPRRARGSGEEEEMQPMWNSTRLDLEKIADIDPWSEMKRYDAEEAGQIQQVLEEFNDMVLSGNKRRNKRGGGRRSGGNEAKAGDKSPRERESMRSSRVEGWKCEDRKECSENKMEEEEEEEGGRRRRENKSSAGKCNAERRSIEKKRASSSLMRAEIEDNKVEGLGVKMETEKFLYWMREGESRDGQDSERSKFVKTMQEPRGGESTRIGSGDIFEGCENENTESFEGEGGWKVKKELEVPGDENREPSSFSEDDNPEDDDHCQRGEARFAEDLERKEDRKETKKPVKESSSKKRSPVKPAKKKSEECNNNDKKYKSRHEKKKEERLARAFEKFGDQFIKQMKKMDKRGKTRGRDEASSDSDSSSTCSTGSSYSGDRSSFSSPCSTSCSCCSTSSTGSSSYTSYTDSTSSCSCSSCCEDDQYSEYTLASSASTYSSSDDSSTD